MIEIIVTIYVLSIVVALVVRPHVGLIMIPIALPFLSYTIRSPITGLNPTNLMIYTAFGMGLMRAMGRSHLKMPVATMPLLLFFTLTLVSWVVGVVSFHDIPGWDSWRALINVEQWVVYTLLYFAYYFGWPEGRSMTPVLRAMCAGVLIVGASIVFELISPSRYLLISGRAGGIFSQANASGGFLASYGLIPITLAVLATRRIPRVFYWAIFGLAVVSIPFTASRAAMLCLVVGVLVYAFYTSRRVFSLLLILACFLAPVYTVLIPEEAAERLTGTLGGSVYEGVAGKFEGGTANRVLQYGVGMKLFAESPLLGHGLGSFYQLSPKYLPPDAPDVARSPHTTFVWIASDMGIFALLAFGFLLWKLAAEGRTLSLNAREKSHRLIGSALISMMAVKLLMNLVHVEFLTGEATAYMWITAGVAGRLNLRAGQEPELEPEKASRRVRSVWRPRVASAMPSRVTRG